MTRSIWRVKTRLPERYLTPCKVLARGKMNTCLIEFEDGYRVATSRNYVIKLETMQKDWQSDSREDRVKLRDIIRKNMTNSKKQNVPSAIQ